MSTLIPVSGGYCALVDEADLPLVSGHRWGLNTTSTPSTAYARCSIGGKEITMHRLIAGAGRGVCVDHINGNGLDNRRANLRLCTHRQNIANTKPRSGRFKGVSRTKNGTWRAVIHAGHKQRHIGIYKTEEEAARAFDAAAFEMHGVFARLNFPRELNSSAKTQCPTKGRRLAAPSAGPHLSHTLFIERS